MSDVAVFQAENGRFVATELARGPWDAGAQHGGAPAALLMRAFERLPAADGLTIARVTYEFLRPVPLGELSVVAEAIRPGRRVQLSEAAVLAPDGTEVVRARALQVQLADGIPTPLVPAPPGPWVGRDNDFDPPFRPMFALDALEIRFVAGSFGGGPSTAWFRLQAPIVAGEEPSPLQRLAAAGDFGNGISAILPWDEYVFINPDLTLYIERPPVGEWIALEAQTTIAPGGIGAAEGVLYDARGRVGRATQALLVARR
jgi:acyl-coenzyme A thioesterase PaaI-like protein